MMKNESSAGTTKSNDVLVSLSANANGRIIELSSPVKDQFEEDILKVTNELLDEYNIDNIKVVLEDKGALNFALRARLKTAILRGLKQ